MRLNAGGSRPKFRWPKRCANGSTAIRHFFSAVSEHADPLVFDEVPAWPEAHFLRWGIGKDCLRKGEGRVFVLLAIPLARFSNERISCKYISDLIYPIFGPIRGRSMLAISSFRAWARLVTVHKQFFCFVARP